MSSIFFYLQCELWKRNKGFGTDFEIIWTSSNIRDRTETNVYRTTLYAITPMLQPRLYKMEMMKIADPL